MDEAKDSYPRAKGHANKECAMEGTKSFGGTKWKLNLPIGYECNSPKIFSLKLRVVICTSISTS